MANNYQPLLDTPKKKTSNVKQILFIFLSLATILGSIAIFYPTILTKTILITSTSLKSHYLCKSAYDRSSCLSVLSEVANTQSSDPNAIIRIVLEKSSVEIKQALNLISRVKIRINDIFGQPALADCLELMDLSMDRVTDSMVALETNHFDAHVWLSAVLTNHVTCLDGLTGSTRLAMKPTLDVLISRARSILAMVASIAPQTIEESIDGLPIWIDRKDMRLMEVSVQINANSVVAKDGSGNYTTVQAAVNATPVNSANRYTIYVKKGTYKEQVTIAKNKKNIMLTGDGMDATVITGSLNYIDGTSTFDSATVIVGGDGFMAQDICFQNTAGAVKEQAVALRSSADKTVFNRAKFDAFQDTLYAHTHRQFYRDCYITGTVDFIFGDAAVVIQNSQVVARMPMSGQENMITAQGRTDKNSVSGTSIQNCNVVPSSDLAQVKSSVRTYLGRPWKEYSRTVFMQSNLDNHIDPAGWAPWNKSLPYLDTLYFGEYQNRGAGAGTGGRVNWKGYHIITSAAEAAKFTVAQLINVDGWLESTGVTYTEGL